LPGSKSTRNSWTCAAAVSAAADPVTSLVEELSVAQAVSERARAVAKVDGRKDRESIVDSREG
jgi:hypothetical protein